MENLFWIYVLLGISIFIGVLNLILFAFIATFLVKLGDAFKPMLNLPPIDLTAFQPTVGTPEARLPDQGFGDGLMDIQTPQATYDPRHSDPLQ